MKLPALFVLLLALQIGSETIAAAPMPQQIQNADGQTPPPKGPQGLSCAPGGACQGEPGSLTFLLPLFISKSSFKSTAVLVNSNSVSTYVDVTVRDAGGDVAAQQRIDIAARNQVQIDIGDLLVSAHSNATRGSVQIAPAADGTGIGVIGQMSITYSGSTEPNYIEYEPTRPNPNNSPVQRAVADAGHGSPIVGITSVAASAQNVTIQCFSTGAAAFSKTVAVPAWGTVVTPACNSTAGDPLDFEPSQNSPAQDGQGHGLARGISLTTDAPPGSYAAFGLAPHWTGSGSFFTVRSLQAGWRTNLASHSALV